MTYLFMGCQISPVKFRFPGYRKDYSVRKVATRATRKNQKVSHRKNRIPAGRFTRHEHNWEKQRCSTTSLKIEKTKRKMDKFYRTVKHG